MVANAAAAIIFFMDELPFKEEAASGAKHEAFIRNGLRSLKQHTEKAKQPRTSSEWSG